MARDRMEGEDGRRQPCSQVVVVVGIRVPQWGSGCGSGRCYRGGFGGENLLANAANAVRVDEWWRYPIGNFRWLDVGV
jgi:hypothetical protein